MLGGIAAAIQGSTSGRDSVRGWKCVSETAPLSPSRTVDVSVSAVVGMTLMPGGCGMDANTVMSSLREVHVLSVLSVFSVGQGGSKLIAVAVPGADLWSIELVMLVRSGVADVAERAGGSAEKDGLMGETGTFCRGRPGGRLVLETVQSRNFARHEPQGRELSHFNFRLRHWSHASLDRSLCSWSRGGLLLLLVRSFPDTCVPREWIFSTCLARTSARWNPAWQYGHWKGRSPVSLKMIVITCHMHTSGIHSSNTFKTNI